MKSTLAAVGDVDEDEPTHHPDLAAVEMDTEVWRYLPPDVLAPILAYLPWWSKLRLQPVCKAWSLLLRDSELLQKFSLSAAGSLPCKLPCCIVRTASGGAICNLSAKKWYPVQQLWPFIPTTPNSTSTAASRDDEPDDFQVVAAAAGVLLLEGKDEDRGRYLFNPLNKTWKQLPPLPGAEKSHSSTCTILGLAADPDSSSFKVIAEQTEYEDMGSMDDAAPELSVMETPPGAMKLCEIYVFDTKRASTSKSTWELATTLQSEIDLRLEIENAVLIGEDLYILMVQPLGWCWMYRVFKAMAASWEEVPADITSDLGHVHLFEHRGSLMLVGGTDVMKSDKALAVSIWRLEKAQSGSNCGFRSVWERVITMPADLIKRLYMLPENGIFYHFDVEGDCACFINPFTEINITCDLVRKSWGSIDRQEYGDDFHYIDDLIFLFTPRLDVVL